MAREGVGEDLPTSHIIYHEEDNNGNVRARFVHLGPDYPPRFVEPNVTICSSSKGILLLHASLSGCYYLYNPFVENYSMKPLTPFLRPQSNEDYNPCFAIIAVTESTVDVVFLRCSFDGVHFYDADVFSSDTDSWFSLMIGDFRRRHILPNSGISCGRNVYFLVDPDDSVFKIDIVEHKHPSLFLPLEDFNDDDTKWVQLGRDGEKVGLVIANKSKSLISLYSLIQRDSLYGWRSFCSVNVVMEHDCDDVSIIQEGGGRLPKRIRCRDMPRPLRFESFKNMQVPFWVDGRIMMLEISGNEPDHHLSSRIFGGLMFPSCITHGLPHVMSKTRLRYCILPHN